MFTGIVERCCKIVSWVPIDEGKRLILNRQPEAETDPGQSPWNDLKIGESIANNGVCLTLVKQDESQLCFDLVHETLNRSGLGNLKPGDWINLERSMQLGDRFGGHYVTGHVDSLGKIISFDPASQDCVLENELQGYSEFQVIEKGSVTIDGISLTVARCSGKRFEVALIPHTLQVTNLGKRAAGEIVNLEMDHFGKWVKAHLNSQQESASENSKAGSRSKSAYKL